MARRFPEAEAEADPEARPTTPRNPVRASSLPRPPPASREGKARPKARGRRLTRGRTSSSELHSLPSLASAPRLSPLSSLLAALNLPSLALKGDPRVFSSSSSKNGRRQPFTRAEIGRKTQKGRKLFRKLPPSRDWFHPTQFARDSADGFPSLTIFSTFSTLNEDSSRVFCYFSLTWVSCFYSYSSRMMFHMAKL